MSMLRWSCTPQDAPQFPWQAGTGSHQARSGNDRAGAMAGAEPAQHHRVPSLMRRTLGVRTHTVARLAQHDPAAVRCSWFPAAIGSTGELRGRPAARYRLLRAGLGPAGVGRGRRESLGMQQTNRCCPERWCGCEGPCCRTLCNAQGTRRQVQRRGAHWWRSGCAKRRQSNTTTR